ncbi:hypothetical protein GCM10010193_32950 [Kitasatospora atroaurantiaca]|uniref:Uncharacterized protein n=1 Tax=Kitasatospora atroaurantiaca TaxID=285545 RepID=A0A561ERM9_9ACTN|nr:hypothetical protein [Kitasatospora atroaurantiaca]TWE18275.1 hypothetical protein FB465_3333 [Kitasatospora atroaurantiaca]
MALRKKGTRLITVDGMAYRWRVSGGAGCCTGCASGRFEFVVEQADQKGAVLMAATSAFPVVPSIVGAGVRAALDQGWQPARRGSAFRLTGLV